MLDQIDRGLIHALSIDGRVPLSRVGTVLGVSTQTVARRYQRLRAEEGLRVVGLPDPERTGLTQWLVRLTAQPATARTLARSLARRPDTSWIKLTSGGTEIVTVVHAPAGAPALLNDIPRAASVTAVSAHFMLHTYLGGPTAWRGRLTALDEEQRKLLQPQEIVPGDEPLTREDHAIIDVLRRDGRLSNTELAAATGLSAATVARRLGDLRRRGAVFFDVEIDAARYGVTTQAFLWMAVAPAELDQVATALATHDELAVVAATTGPTNLIAHALCPDPPALHRYLTRRLGALPAIHTLHTAPVLETLKATGPIMRWGEPDAISGAGSGTGLAR